MFDITVRSLPHFILIWYLKSILHMKNNDINVIVTAFVSAFIAFVWNNKNKPKKWYWKLDYTYMTIWSLLELSLAITHPDISMFLVIAFVNQFVFFTNSLIDTSNDVPKWKYVLWNNMCFVKTTFVMACLRKFPY
jgi:hypothetical protein